MKMKKINCLSTDAWKKAVLEGQVNFEVDQDLRGKSLRSTYLLIFDHSNNPLEKMCIVLDPNVMANGYR